MTYLFILIKLTKIIVFSKLLAYEREPLVFKKFFYNKHKQVLTNKTVWWIRAL